MVSPPLFSAKFLVMPLGNVEPALRALLSETISKAAAQNATCVETEVV